MAKYSFVNNDGNQVLTVFHDGELISVTDENPHFERIFDLVRNDEVAEAARLMNPENAIREYFEKVSEQVSVRNGVVLFEGDEIHDALTDKIVEYYENGQEDFKPLVLFLEKLQQNPNEHSVEHLYRWIKDQHLTVSDQGDIVAYKGVDNDLLSIHAGDGIVDGIEYKKANLPNHIGAEVEMPRSSVTFDPSDGCSFGLHAGTWDYANSFGRRTLEVHINPRDVVSVPTDCSDQKMRVCRYKVVEELDKPYSAGEYSVTVSYNLDDAVSSDWLFEGDDDDDGGIEASSDTSFQHYRDFNESFRQKGSGWTSL